MYNHQTFSEDNFSAFPAAVDLQTKIESITQTQNNNSSFGHSQQQNQSQLSSFQPPFSANSKPFVPSFSSNQIKSFRSMITQMNQAANLPNANSMPDSFADGYKKVKIEASATPSHHSFQPSGYTDSCSTPASQYGSSVNTFQPSFDMNALESQHQQFQHQFMNSTSNNHFQPQQYLAKRSFCQTDSSVPSMVSSGESKKKQKPAAKEFAKPKQSFKKAIEIQNKEEILKLIPEKTFTEKLDYIMDTIV